MAEYERKKFMITDEVMEKLLAIAELYKKEMGKEIPIEIIFMAAAKMGIDMISNSVNIITKAEHLAVKEGEENGESDKIARMGLLRDMVNTYSKLILNEEHGFILLLFEDSQAGDCHCLSNLSTEQMTELLIISADRLRRQDNVCNHSPTMH